MKRVIAWQPEGRRRQDDHRRQPCASLAATHARVLLIDQRSAGQCDDGLRRRQAQLRYSMTDVLLGDCDLAAALVPVDPGGFTVLPATRTSSPPRSS